MLARGSPGNFITPLTGQNQALAKTAAPVQSDPLGLKRNRTDAEAVLGEAHWLVEAVVRLAGKIAQVL